MATKKEPAAQAVENAVETVEKTEAKAEEKDDGMVTIWRRAAATKASTRWSGQSSRTTAPRV